MDFKNKDTQVLLYFNEQKMFLNGVLYKITKSTDSHSMKYCRFNFGENNEAKIYNDLLTLNMNGITSTLLLQDTKNVDVIGDKYLISPGKYLFLEKGNEDYFFINDDKINILTKYKEGIYTIYDTKEGSLYISSDKTRNSRWNNCSIFLSS